MADPALLTARLRPVATACSSLNHGDAGSIAVTLVAGGAPSDAPDLPAAALAPALCAAAAACAPAGPAAPPADAALLWTLSAALDAVLRALPPEEATMHLGAAIQAAYLPLLDPGAGLRAGQGEEVQAAAVAAIARAGDAGWALAVDLIRGACAGGAGAVRLAAALLEAALAAPGGAAAPALLCAAEDAFPAALDALATGSAAKPTPTVAAIGQSLLPACLAAAQRAGRLPACLARLWAACSRLGASPAAADRSTGLALLVQFGRPLVAHSGAAADPALWALLLQELAADQGLNRKRALHVLELALAHLQEEGQGQGTNKNDKKREGVPDASNAAAWIAFVRLYTTVEDTSMHLFKEAWPEVDRIQAPADGADGDGDDAADSKVLALPLPWVLLLWSKALSHRHITAQKIAAASFLRRAWPRRVLAALPPGFADEVLIPAFGQASMQRGELAEELVPGAPRFFAAWAAAAPQGGRAALLAALLSALAARQQQQGVVLFAARALAATAAGAAPLDPLHQADFLRGGAAAATAQPGFGANAVALKVYPALVSAAADCVSIDSVGTLELVGAWLAAIPAPLLQPGGLTRPALTAWLRQPRHAALGDALREMVQRHVDSVGAGPGKAGPSARDVAAAALAVGEALGGPALEAALAPWSAAVEGGSGGVAEDGALPLLTALVSAATALPGAAHAPAARSALGDTLRALFQRALGPICTAEEAHAAWLLSQAAPGAVARLGAAIDSGCAAAGVTAGAAYDRDAVLPPWFLGPRNAACDAVAAVAGGAALLEAGDADAAAEAHRALAALAQSIVDDFTAVYPSLFTAKVENGGENGAGSGTVGRAPLEVAIALLRPLSTCCQVHFPRGEPVVTLQRAEQLIYGALEGLQAGGTFMPCGPAPSSGGSRRKKTSVKLEPLTLHSWHHLLTWRVLDGTLAARGVAAALPPAAQAAALAAAAASLALAPEGANGPLHYIRCIRALLPALVAAPLSVAPPFLARCRELAAAAPGGALDPAAVPEPSASLDAALGWMGGVLLSALTTNVRRRGRMAAGVLSCALHPCLFDPRLQGVSAAEGAALHRPGGAVRGVVEGLKAASGRHSRLLVLFSTQLAALLAAFPALGPAYADFLVDWTLTGFEGETALGPLADVALDEPTVAELAALLEPLDAELARAHAASYAAPRVGTLCLLHAWVQEAAAAGDGGGGGGAAAGAGWGGGPAGAAAGAAWDALLGLALGDPELSSARYLHNGATHRKKVRVWQALAVLAPGVPPGGAEPTLARLLEALDATNAATVKQYQEIAAAAMLARAPALLEAVVLPRLEDYTAQRVEAVPSLITLAAVGAIRAERAAGEGAAPLLRRVVSAVLPWAGSFVHGSRSFAQLVLWRLGELFPWLGAQDPSFAAFQAFFRSNAELARLRAAMGVAQGLDGFDLARATSPRGVLCEEAALVGTSHTGGPLEGAPAPLMDALADYLLAERMALRGDLAATMAENAAVEQRRRGGGGGDVNGDVPRAESTLGEVYQRKITPSDKEAAVTDPWGAALGLAALAEARAGAADPADDDDPLRRAVDEAAAAARAGARQELIVVASLVDRLPNLAGLARTCEVFRASRLVLGDARVTKDPQFASISVSAEHWVPIEEVPPVALEPWLRRKAAEGFALVGLEQTAESAALQDYVFPARTVLLLGAEREGVPAALLPLLDATVEIPQLGVVRSLNVHVSAAIGIYEFTRQRLAAAAARALQAGAGV